MFSRSTKKQEDRRYSVKSKRKILNKGVEVEAGLTYSEAFEKFREKIRSNYEYAVIFKEGEKVEIASHLQLVRD